MGEFANYAANAPAQDQYRVTGGDGPAQQTLVFKGAKEEFAFQMTGIRNKRKNTVCRQAANENRDRWDKKIADQCAFDLAACDREELALVRSIVGTHDLYDVLAKGVEAVKSKGKVVTAGAAGEGGGA